VKTQGLNKKERLKGNKRVAFLFEKGKTVKSDLLRLLYLNENNAANSIMFIVPKKKIKLAVERNKIKRRMKEAFRKEKASIYKSFQESNINGMQLAVVFQGKQVEKFDAIHTSLKHTFEKCINNSKNSIKT
jgi:ribonuclease P protein component